MAFSPGRVVQVLLQAPCPTRPSYCDLQNPAFFVFLIFFNWLNRYLKLQPGHALPRPRCYKVRAAESGEKIIKRLLICHVYNRESQAAGCSYARVANVSDSVKKILDAEHRINLQHAYYRLILTQKGGLPVKNLLVSISDPAPIRGSDYIEIPPGGEKSFKFKTFPLLIKLLPPGVYEAYIRFWPIPYQSTAYASPVVQFTITE